MKLKLLVLSFLTICSIYAQDVPKLHLSASATIWKPSDELQLKIGVITLGETAEGALAENSGKMRKILASLEMVGFDKNDYETSQFSINPTYTPYPQNPPPHWRPSINGYEVTNSILIHTPKLDMAGQVIDLANQAGANSITDIRFGLRHSRDYWTEALTAAGTNAISDAQAIARATGVQLIRVLSITLNHTQVRSPQINLPCMAKVGDASPPIEPGEVSIEANVTLVYEIK
ncbi:MAG: putative periplasmic immunogenic protein [Parachlamydiales bacterium]|nr:putative periplasmic immunogenic protein [Parachlamydiales bacterium]